MCVDPESASRHARRIQLDNRCSRSRAHEGRRVIPTRRVRLHVPTVLAALEVGAIDVIEHLEAAAHTPRLFRLREPAVFVTPDGMAAAMAERQRREDAADAWRFAEQNPYAVLNVA